MGRALDGGAVLSSPASSPVAPAPSSPSSTAPATTYRPHLDGIRAVAVTLVVLFHLDLGWLPGGFVGVDVFFVLSGYLITGLLVDEAARDGSVRLLRFYARRARRLLPAAWAVIAFVLVVGAVRLDPLELHDRQHEASAALLYVANWDWILRDVEYVAADDVASPLLHFWSLAVEEQFYLAWPAVVLGVWLLARRVSVRRRSSRTGGSHARSRGGGVPLDWLLVVLAATTVASAVAAVLLTPSPMAYYGTHTRAFELTAGGLLAVALRRARVTPGAGWGADASAVRAVRRRTQRWALGGVAAGIVAVLWQARTVVGTGSYPGWHALVVTAGAVVLILGTDVGGRTLAARGLGTPVLAWVGRLSYSVYVWHWPFIVLLADDLGGWLVPAIVGVSCLSFTLIEQPVRRRVWPSAPPVWVVATGLAVSLGLGLGVVPALDRSNPVDDLAFAASRDIAPPGDCPYRGDTWPDADLAEPCVMRRGAGATVAYVGDSHAHQWQPALQVLAEERDWTLLRVTRGGCPATDVTVSRNDDAGVGAPDVSCSAWRRAIYPRLVAEYDPDVVVLATRSHVAGLIAADGSKVRPEEEPHLGMWLEGWDWTLDTLAAGGAQVVLSSIMPTLAGNTPSCLIEHGLGTDACDFPAADPVVEPYNAALRALVATRDDVVMFAPVTFVCPGGTCPALDEDGLIIHRDNNHVTATYAGAHAAELGVLLDAAAGSAAR